MSARTIILGIFLCFLPGVVPGCASTDSETSADARTGQTPAQEAALTLSLDEEVSQAIALARAALDPPGLAEGDYDRAARALLETIAKHPSHPLAASLFTRTFAWRDRMANRRAYLEAVDSLLTSQGKELSPTAWITAQFVRRELWLQKGDESQLLRAGDHLPGYVARWAAIGPFGDAFPDTLSVPFPPERGLSFDDSTAGLGGRALRWRPTSRRPFESHLDLSELSDLREGSVYAKSQIRADHGTPAYLEVAASGSYAVWWNGEEVTRHNLAFEPSRAAEPIPVSIRAGWNQLLVKLEARGSRWVSARLFGPTGAMISGLEEEGGAVDRGIAPAAGAASRPEPWLTTTARIARYLDKLAGADGTAELLAFRGVLRASNERESEAIADLRAAVALRPDDPSLHLALGESILGARYLPETEAKNRGRESMERVLTLRAGCVPALLAKSDLLSRDDRMEEALAALTEAAKLQPQSFLPARAKLQIFRRLGWAGERRKALAEMLEKAPAKPEVHFEAAAAARQEGDHVRELRELDAVAALDASHRSAAERRIELWLLAGEGARALGERERWMRLYNEPSERLRLAATLESLGRSRDALSALEAAVERRPFDPQAQMALAELRRRLGEDALPQYARLLEAAPGDEHTRTWHREAGGGLAGDSIFGKYRIDWRKAIAEYQPKKSDERAPDTQIVDQQIERLLRDGSVEKETIAVYRVNDQRGVEQHGSAQFQGELLELKVVHPDGSFDEPTPAGGDYALSKLQPGDFIVIRYRTHDEASAGAEPLLGRWMFQSQERAFVISQYVLALPKGDRVRIAEKNFDGEHTIEEGDAETVHIYTRRRSERLLREGFQPDPYKFLPWIQAGTSRTPQQLFRLYRAQAHSGTDDSVEVREATKTVLAKLPESASDRDRVAAIFAFINETLIDRAGNSATRSLLEKRGSPFALLLAMVRASGIPYEPAMVRPVSAGADEEPTPEFLDPSRYGYPMLRIRPRGGESFWVDISQRQQPFGQIPTVLSGAEVMILAAGGPSIEHLPALPDEEWAQGELDSTVRLTGGQGASVEVMITLRNALAWSLRERIRNLSDVDRRNMGTQIANSVVRGIELEKIEFPGLDDRSAPLRFRLAGQLPNYLRQGAQGLEAPMLMQPVPLGRQFSDKGKRKLPLRVQTPMYFRERLRVLSGGGLALPEPPAPVVKKEGAVGYSLRAIKVESGVEVERVLTIQPSELPAADVPAFLALCRTIEEAEESKLPVGSEK